MTLRLARRIRGLPESATIAMSVKARALKAQGVGVISLAIGEPDFESPPEAIEAAVATARRGDTKYPPVSGQFQLKAAVMEKFARENGLSYAPHEILIGNGGKQLIYNAFAATIDQGDEVLIPAPYWVTYPLVAEMMGGTVSVIPCHEKDGFRLRASALQKALTPRSRWFVMNSPNNPTGAVLDRGDLEAIADVLRAAPHVLILSDEIYEHLTFEGHQHESLAAIAPDLKARILTVNGVAKAYAMTGWRVGFCGGNNDLIKAMTVIQGHSTSGVCTLAQAGATAALTGSMALRTVMRETYLRRRDFVVDALRSIPLLTCALPDGAFYAFPGVEKTFGQWTPSGRQILSSRDLAEALLDEAHVCVVPGDSFGDENHIRISFAASDTHLHTACERLKIFFSTLR